MSDDELEQLHAADPVGQASVPSATDPTARTLFERITMTSADTSDPIAPGPRHDQTRRPRTVLAAAAAVVLIAAVGGAVALTDGNDREPATVATGPTTPSTSGGPITPGGSSSASCVEFYDLDTLKNRETAFDGTVKVVDGDSVVFAINQWYRGGDSAEASLRGAEMLAGATSAGAAVSLEPGSRLLVAGDGGFAWSCGFTQLYDADIAADWGEALAG